MERRFSACARPSVTRYEVASCVARVRFARLYPRKNGFRVAFALRRRLKSPRIVKTADYGPKWRGHFVDILSAADFDDELRAWLQESHDTVGTQRDLAPSRVAGRRGAKGRRKLEPARRTSPGLVVSRRG